MSYYRYHLFVCSNQRVDGSPCCGDFQANASREYLKQRCKDLGIHQPGGVRINKAGCMGRCQEGPVMAVYPEAVWYTYIDQEDLEEILQSHLLGGQIVDRLRLSSEPKH
jgi:(2Fe-2S) ferredoxin